MSSVPQTVLDLVERFERNLDAYRSGQYKEAQVRIEFIDPLFKALGWDVDNVRGYAEAYKDVIHEDAIKIGGYTKAPDYCFRIGGARKFFVEAKKPAVRVKEEISPAYQLRRYAWSAKLPLSILTDFEEFAVYDCRVRPVVTDRASKARVLYMQYTDYAERWDEIATIFAKEAVLKGSFDKYAESTRRKRGTAEVDAAFLQEIDSWRDGLARNLALRNPTLTSRDLNYAVQHTIDRIIFLRICEDRAIEVYGRLLALLNGGQVYARLCDLYRQADERYNSGLFHFRHEKGRAEEPDELTPSLIIDDALLKGIIKSLYYPDSPYEFSVLPADILGQVYEQFLGKVIRLTPGHRAIVEYKPVVKKAGGVYYTPTYIVDYIVEHTVGELLKDSNPRKAAKLRILDPACGSGSFLLGAYQRLLDWHRDWYVADGPESWATRRNPRLYQGRGGEWRLTTAERKRILLNNIYGVDIDSQAVEVSKLSLLLKVLEGESGETLARQLAFFRERALPDLATNIKCGNSLIGTDFYEGQQMSLLDEEEIYRVDAFDWETEFQEIMAGGGFDAVIGNPPWVMAGYYVSPGLEYLRARYHSAKGKFDLYYVFIELGIRLLNEAGQFGMIVPNKFFHTGSAGNLRGDLASKRLVHALVDFGYEKVFSGATNYSCIVLLRNSPSELLHFAEAKADLSIVRSYDVPAKDLGDGAWHFVEPRARALFGKMEALCIPLSSIVQRFGTGVQSGADRVLMLDGQAARQLGLEQEMLRAVFRGRDVRRYRTSRDPKKVVFPYSDSGDEFSIYTEDSLRSRYAKTYSYLCEHRSRLSKRVWFGKSARQLSGQWYGLMYLDSRWAFAKPHLLTPSLANRSSFALGDGTLFVTGTAGVTSVIPIHRGESILYLLGVLNSSLLSFYALQHSPVFQGGYYKFSAPYLKQLPIRTIDFSDPADVARHDRMVALVERMLALHEQLAAAKTPTAKTALQRQIDATDREIDRLVYEMYDLTEEEIGIVEGATG